MRTLMAVGMVLMLATPVFAAKPCEELKAEIEAKLKAKGVEGYSLEIVANDDVKDQTVVGSCDGGTKKIVYKREK
jgi:Protein of unknown function (DUF1161)